MNMYEKMKKKGIPATNVIVSSEIVKTVPKAESVALFRQLESISMQNRNEYNTGLEYLETHPCIYDKDLSLNQEAQSGEDTKEQTLLRKL